MYQKPKLKRLGNIYKLLPIGTVIGELEFSHLYRGVVLVWTSGGHGEQRT
jgi:hypothetical protein